MNTPDPVAGYKSFLRETIDKRPSGTRQKLAAAFGTHPSFISQITNPGLKVPLPAQHIPTLFQVCHFTHDEQAHFLELYTRAHPAQAGAIIELAESERNIVKIVLPEFSDPARGAEIAAMIRNFADQLIAFVQRQSASDKGDTK
jgi:hypothetical protein